MSETKTKADRRPPNMDAVVELVDSLGGSTGLSNKELASKALLGERTFTRALAAAAGFGLVEVEYLRSSGAGSVARVIRLPKSNETTVEVSQ